VTDPVSIDPALALLAPFSKGVRILSLRSCGIDDTATLFGKKNPQNESDPWNKLAEISLQNGELSVREIRKIADEGWEYLQVEPETFQRMQGYQAFASRFESSFPSIFGDEEIGITCDLRVPDRQPELKEFVSGFKKRHRRYPSVLNWQGYPAIGCLFPNCVVFTPPNPDAEALPYMDSSIDVVLIPEDDTPKKMEAKRVATSAVMEIAIVPEKNPWLAITLEHFEQDRLGHSKSGQHRKKWLGQITPAARRRIAPRGDQPTHQGGVRLVAFYSTDFDPGPGNAQPLFLDHNPPRRPTDSRFYDIRQPETRQAQADMARAHGIEAFCYWHSWFQGKRLPSPVIDEVLASGRPDFPFCLCWTNEPSDSCADDLHHIHWLIGPLSDPRAFRVDGKPVFIVSQARRLPNPRATTDCWRREAASAGLPGLYLMALETEGDEGWNPIDAGFDATILFQPQSRFLEQVPELDLGPSTAKVFDYDEALQVLAKPPPVPYPRYETVLPGWDNSPRLGAGACVLDGNRPSSYEDWLRLSVQRAMERPKDERIVFINAWNGWKDGAHLEPDRKHGHGFLEATQRVVAATRQDNPG